MLHDAAHGLADEFPELSARGGLSSSQRRASFITAIGVAITAVVHPQLVYWAGFTIFAVLIIWRGGLVVLAKLARTSPTHLHLSDDELPLYSVLVALYDEAPSAAGLIAALNRINYPPDKLDVHLLIEACDDPTLRALAQLRLPENFHIHTLASGTPRTKPRALNYGLQLAAGKYVTIYDAEDRPHPDQIRIAAETFTSAPANTACLQAPLVAHNRSESWLAAQWALEYDIQFGLLVPALAKAGFPVPLGGTSNHFNRAILEASGGWDAWNVTEDADLGLRLARFGYQIGVIAPPTREEAPESLPVWANQRSRWIKGFLQSWFVLMRKPLSAAKQMGWINWAAMQITLGGAILSAILAGPMAIWLMASIYFSPWHLGPSGLCLLFCGYGVNILAALTAPGHRCWHRTVSVATLPLYWPLLSFGAARALYGLIRTPHFWAKTPHGLTAARIDESPTLCPISTGSLRLAP